MITILNGQTWLICGGRDFADKQLFEDMMRHLLRLKGCPSTIVHGGAKGADSMASEFGCRMAITTIAVVPEWSRGRMAGPLRNQKMLDLYKPNLVVAFPGGTGTADMVRRAKAANVEVAEIKITDNQ